MNDVLKRFLSLALALVMVIGMMPMHALAAEGDEPEPECVHEYEHDCSTTCKLCGLGTREASHDYAGGTCSYCGAEDPTEESTKAPTCVCDVKCSEQVNNNECSVCADGGICTGKAPERELAKDSGKSNEIPARPTATVTELKDEDFEENDPELTFALNFKADAATDEQLAYYGGWYADFELTFSKDVTLNANGGADGYLSGQYDEWSENWVNVPFDDVTLTANTPLKIMAYAAEQMGQSGLKYTYGEVYESVKDFDCGVFLEDDFLAANVGETVTLELKMYNPENEEESYVIGQTYKFEIPAPKLPTATVTEIENEDLTFALNFKADAATEAQLAYYGGWYADFELTFSKDVTLNANGGANGYLSGQYDEWSENWVNVPFDDVTLTANTPLKIMEYAAELMGQSGLKYTYGEVYESVKDFDCGVFLEDDFLAANVGETVTLELKMYNPENEEESFVIGQTYKFEIPAPKLPTATVTKIENEDLTFALNFKADEATDAQLAYYGNWYADFELTMDTNVTFNADGGADGYLSGQYDAWSENWVNVPFEDVTLEADEPLKIMEYASELMGQSGLKYTYKEVYEVVKDFDCGVFFEEDFIAQNAGKKVTLQLKMYNPEDESINYVIGDTYTFTIPTAVPELPTATVTEIENEDLTFALNFKADEATEAQLAYYGDWYADFVLKINKDVTFNANGGADGYLSGQYDEWSENWVSVPFENVELKADTELKIMEYASELMGQSGLKVTYNDVYNFVKDFDCGVYLTPKFIAENYEDLEITLELRMYNREDETESYVIGETYVFTIPELPTATVKDTTEENDDLTFSMNFKADAATDEQLAFYGDWYADFELTMDTDVTFNANGGADGYLSGQYDAWSENWVNVPFEDVTLEADEPLKIMEYASELMGQSGLKYTYKEVYEVVKDFDCGVFFEDLFIAQNAGKKVTLQLKMYNPEDERINYVIGETYTFIIPKSDYVCWNTKTGTLYETVLAGTLDAAAGETVQLLKDVSGNLAENFVSVLDGRTLDLNGYTLETSYLASFGNVVDNSEDNTGLLIAPEIMLQKDNAQLPIKDGDGYRFFVVTQIQYAFIVQTDTELKYVFAPGFEPAAHDLLMKGQAASAVKILVNVDWKKSSGEPCDASFYYNDAMVQGYIGSFNGIKYEKMYTLSVADPVNFAELTCTAMVRSDLGVEFSPNSDNIGGANANTNTPTTTNTVTSQEVTVTSNNASATVAKGTKLDGTTDEASLTLQVSTVADSEANVSLEQGEDLKSVDVHVEGIASDNTIPVTVTLPEFLTPGLNIGNVRLYHVENGETVEMTRVESVEDFTAHNQYWYDPVTGDVVLYMATFSEVTAVADTENAWNGEFDYSWYTNAVEGTVAYTIANADQLAAFGAIVGGMAEGIDQDSFKDKTVKLLSDINLGGQDQIFYPIGYYNSTKSYEKVSGGSVTSDVNSFEGTFDGNGHTISNFYQNTWEMFGDYNNGYSGTPNHYKDAMGLFGYVLNGTVKNLTVDNFSSDGEFTPTGVIAAFAVNSTFENIAITNCNPRVYNTGNGGIVGIGGDSSDTAASKLIFKNITIDNTNKISALWGSWDVACGGLMGMFFGPDDVANASRIEMTNCHVAAQIDVNNDVCGNYQYYWYRYSGMMVGTIDYHKTENGYTVPDTSMITASGCTVHFGEWNDYYYCELVANSLASYTHDHQFSRLTEVDSVNTTNLTVTVGDKTTAIPTSGRYNYVVVNGDSSTENATCYHFVDGAVWKHEDAGKETVNGNEVLKEDKQHIYLPFNQLFTGYGWGVKNIPVYNGEDYAFDGITILDRKVADSVEKFEAKEITELANEKSYTIDQIFSEKTGNTVEIKDDAVIVSITDLDETDGLVTAEFVRGETWDKGTITFTGTGKIKITIQDYNFCTPTTTKEIEIKNPDEMETVERFDYKFPNIGKYLYRVGNKNSVAIGYLFEEIADGVGNVGIDVKTIYGNASGTYTKNDTDWTKGTIQFTGSGVVEVTIYDDNFSTPVTLELEVIDAKNITSAEGTTTGGVFALLCDVNSSNYVYYWNCTLYGNGFTYSLKDAPTNYNSSQGHGVLMTKNATLDNLVIVGDIYAGYGAYTSNNYYNAAIDVMGETVIQNCYISGCAAPVSARANVTIKNTTLYGGTVANLIIKDGTAVLEDVTTANYDDGRDLIGMGIVVHSDATEAAKLVLNGTFTQYNFVNEKNVPSDTNAKYLYDIMFGSSCSNYQFGSSPDRYVNTGIISMTTKFDISDITDNVKTGYEGQYISTGTGGYVYTQPNTSGSVNNGYVEYEANTQGAVPPSYSFDFTKKNYVAKTDGSNDYCYLENDVVKISMDEGDTFNWDTSILTVEKAGETLEYTVTMNGTDYTGKSIPFNTAGDYEVVYTYTDNNNYKLAKVVTYPQTYTQTVKISVAVIKPTTKHAEFALGKSNQATEKITVDTKTYISATGVSHNNSTWSYITVNGTKIFYPIVEATIVSKKTAYFNVFRDVVTITDYADGGTGDAITYNSSTTTMPSGLTVVKGVYKPFADISSNWSTLNDTALTYSGASNVFKYAGSASASSTPTTYSGALCFKSPDVTNARAEYITIAQYSYTDAANTTYYYYVGYHLAEKGDGGGCVTPDTLITLADGTQKEIQYVTPGEEVVVWNFHTGAYEVQPLTLAQVDGESEMNVLHLYFEDGTELKVLGEHGIFDADQKSFIFIDQYDVEEYVGHNFVKQSGNGYETVKLVDYEVTNEDTKAYTILSAYHYNVLLENMWTVTPAHVGGNFFNPFEIGEGMKYDEAQVQADIEKYGLYLYEDFAHVLTEEQFELLNIAQFKVSVGKGLVTYEGLIYLIENFINR